MKNTNNFDKYETIKGKAKDIYGNESDWGTTISDHAILVQYSINAVLDEII